MQLPEDVQKKIDDMNQEQLALADKIHNECISLSDAINDLRQNYSANAYVVVLCNEIINLVCAQDDREDAFQKVITVLKRDFTQLKEYLDQEKVHDGQPSIEV